MHHLYRRNLEALAVLYYSDICDINHGQLE